MARVTLVFGNDWQGIYVNGELREEGHSISALNALCAVKAAGAFEVDCVDADNDWLDHRGDLPQRLEDVVKESE
jgi:hypothetical protein